VAAASTGEPPLDDLREELVQGIRSFIRRIAAILPLPRHPAVLGEILMAVINCVPHRTRLRSRYRVIEAAPETLAALSEMLAADWAQTPRYIAAGVPPEPAGLVGGGGLLAGAAPQAPAPPLGREEPAGAAPPALKDKAQPCPDGSAPAVSVVDLADEDDWTSWACELFSSPGLVVFSWLVSWVTLTVQAWLSAIESLVARLCFCTDFSRDLQAP